MKKSILFILFLVLVLCFGCTQSNEIKHTASYANGEILPFPEPSSASVAGKTLKDSKHQWRKAENHLLKDARIRALILFSGFMHLI